MTDWLKKALTRKITIKTTQKQKHKTIQIESNPKLVYGIKFSIIMSLSLTLLQTAHMAFLGTWSSEIFAAILGLIGTISGVLITQHA